MASIKDLTKLTESGGEIIDDVQYSSEEKDNSINSRHNTDMNSDSWLSKNIRPLTLLFLLLCQAALIVGWIYGIKPDNILTGQIGTLLFGAFSFYFSLITLSLFLSNQYLSNQYLSNQYLSNRRDKK